MIRVGANAEEVTARLLSDLPTVAYFRVDADRNVVEVSPAMERLTGFEADDVLGRSCLRLHRCEDCLRGCGVFDNHEVFDKELELYRSDGSTVRVRKSGRVFLDEEGEITGALEIVHALDPVADGVGASGQKTDAHESPEAAEIRSALEAARYRRGEAARLLGISRTTLWRRMREHGL